MRFPAPLTLNSLSHATCARHMVTAVGMMILGAGSSGLAGDFSSLSSISQREIQRRQSLVNSAEAQLGEGQLLMSKARPDEAARDFLAAYQALPKSPATNELRSRARAAYAEAACAWARNLLNEGHYAQADKVIASVLEADMDPGNKQALALRKDAADPDRYPPALTPTHINNTKEVIRLLTLAGSAKDLGDYDKAREYYAQVLRIDAYNTAARHGMEHVEKIRSHYFNAARDQTRAKMLGVVDGAWEDSVPPSDKMTALLASSNGGGSIAAKGGRELVEKKLRELKVAHVEFVNAGLEEVMEYLRVTSRNVDPAGRGVDFIINLDAEARGRQLSINMNNVPLEELLRYVTQMAGVTYRIETNAVMIVSLTERSTTLVSKSYKVPPDFIQTAAVDPAAGAAADPFAKGPAAGVAAGLQVRRMGAKEFLEGRGVAFGEGASASFSGGSSTLIVRNTADNINLVDSLVEQAMANGSKQAVISVRMIDVSQTRLSELGFDWELGQFNVPGSNRVFASGGGTGNPASASSFTFPGGGNPDSTLVTGGLRSSGEILGQPGISALIAANGNSGAAPNSATRTPATFGLLGINTDPQFQMAMRALNQSKGVDLVTAPSITVKSGQKSSVRVVREFPYPTEFNPPQIPQNVGVAGQKAPITPTTPTAFAVREVGTILEVEPVISGDGRTVEISLTPSDIEFEGFIDYGTPITTTSSNTSTNIFGNAIGGQADVVSLQPNHIFQPIFRNTHVTTAVNVYDGSTVVLGGLVSDKVTDINDKVPVIGDIPLVGRFWQSKVRQSEKRCILFFVTVKVIDPSGQRISQVVSQ